MTEEKEWKRAKTNDTIRYIASYRAFVNVGAWSRGFRVNS